MTRWKHPYRLCTGLLRDRSLWPLAAFGLFWVWMTFRMMSRPYAFTDDLIHYFPLHAHLPGGSAPTPPGWETFTGKSLTYGVKIVYVPAIMLFSFLGAKYPFISASKFLGLACILASFSVYAAFLGRRLGKTTGRWAAFLATIHLAAAQTLQAGLVRSFGAVLFGLWIWALGSKNVLAVSAVMIGAGIFYPVILPVMGISLFFLSVFGWRGCLPAKKRGVILLAGFVGCMASSLPWLLSGVLKANAETPMTLEEMRAVLLAWDFPQHLDVERLMGLSAGLGIADWVQFNLFDYGTTLAIEARYLIGLCAALLLALGLYRRFWRNDNGSCRAENAACLAALAGALGAYFIGDPWRAPYRALCWWFALVAIFVLAAGAGRKKSALPIEIKAIIAASVPAFIIIAIFCRYNFYAMLDPGRQIQKVFSGTAGVAAALFLAGFFSSQNQSPHGRKLPFAAIVTVFFLGLSMAGSTEPLYVEYPHEQAMAKLKELPDGATILAHPQTADFILLMAGKSTYSSSEMIRIGAKPYTPMVLENYSEAVSVLYADSPEPACEWCRKTGDEGAVLIEEDRYGPDEISRLFVPWKDALEKRRQSGYFWQKLPAGSMETLAPKVHLLKCAGLQEALKGPVTGKSGTGLPVASRPGAARA